MSNVVSLDVLRSLDVASPCSGDWASMTGDDRVRHCASCDLNVYNLSAMTAEEAAGLVTSTEGRLCARFYRRADGTVLTRDCPVGLRLLRARARKAAGRLAAAAVFLLCAGFSARDGRSMRLASVPPFSIIRAWLTPASAPPPVTRVIMGAVACPPIQGKLAAPSPVPQGASKP